MKQETKSIEPKICLVTSEQMKDEVQLNKMLVGDYDIIIFNASPEQQENNESIKNKFIELSDRKKFEEMSKYVVPKITAHTPLSDGERKKRKRIVR